MVMTYSNEAAVRIGWLMQTWPGDFLMVIHEVKQIGSLLPPHLIGRNRNILDQVNKSLMEVKKKKKKSHGPSISLRLEWIFRPQTPWMKKGKEKVLKDGPLYIATNVHCSSLSQPEGSMAFTRVHCGKGNINNWISGEILDTNSKRSKISLWPFSHRRDYEGQVINRVLDRVPLTVGPENPWTQSVTISSVLECLGGIDILGNWQNPYMGALTSGLRAIMVGKAKSFHHYNCLYLREQ